MGYEKIENRQDYKRFLYEDLRAHGSTGWRFYYRVTKPELYYQRLLRRTEYSRTLKGAFRLVYYVARYRLGRYSLKTGISIPPGVFGPGLSIAHYGSIVVNDQARFGRYCRIHSATNVGVYGGKSPSVGDFVYLGPGAVLYGGIQVGSNCTVGANTVVGQDMPDSSTALGSPVKVIHNRDSKRVMPSWISVLQESG